MEKINELKERGIVDPCNLGLNPDQVVHNLLGTICLKEVSLIC